MYNRNNVLLCLQVNEVSKSMIAWEEQMAELRSEYEQLLYFSVPKLLHLYQNLTVPEPSPESIIHDVGFLFENTPSVQAQLKKTIQVIRQNFYNVKFLFYQAL